MIKAVLIDLDGTLVDTAPDIYAAACATLTDLNAPLPDMEEVKHYVGDGLPRFIKRLLTRQWWGEPPTDLFNRATALMNVHYERHCTMGRRVYAGVVETLTELQAQGIHLACVTNKPERFTTPLLEACGLAPFFAELVCGDSLPHKKPHPAPLQHACAELGVAVENALMVGDSLPDSGAAAAAGCRFVAVSYGYHRDGVRPPADATINNFGELLAVVDGMRENPPLAKNG